MQQAKKQRVMYWLSFRGGLIMMKRKLTSLFLATAMVMTTLAGCGNSGGKTAAKVDTSEAAQQHREKFLIFIAGIRNFRKDLNTLKNQENYLQM